MEEADNSVEKKEAVDPNNYSTIGSNDVFEDKKEECLAYHTIIIDCAPIGFVDTMGVAMLEQVLFYLLKYCILIFYHYGDLQKENEQSS